MQKEVFSQSICLIGEVAKMYYIDGMHQQDIAMHLNISKPTVSRLLKLATKYNVVSTKITEPFADCIRVQEELMKIYHTKKIYVVPVQDMENNLTQVKKAVAIEGARYLQRMLSDEEVLGFSWGGTMYHMMQVLNPCQKKSAHLMTLHGNISECGVEYDVQSLVRRAAMSIGGKKHILNTEGYFESQEVLNEYKKSKDYAEFKKWINHLTISFAGIGNWYPINSSPLRPSVTNYMSQKEYEELKEKKVAADFLLRYIDIDGKEIESDIKKRTLSINLGDYQKIPCKVILASGEHKTIASRAILRGNYADVMIMDYQLAKSIYFS